MNIYIVCEGEIGEKNLYRDWVPRVNNNLTYVNDLFDIENNDFSILVGGGYPNYFDIIETAIDDVNSHNNIDRLVIAVDSEEIEYSEKYNEIYDFISDKKCSAVIHIIIQHFCLETWALGNKKIIRPSPQRSSLREYKKFFDIRSKDPELLPEYPPERLSRVRFSEKYLRAALNDKFRNLTYNKSNPGVMLHQHYFEYVKKRCIEDGHISSFNDFLNAFK